PAVRAAEAEAKRRRRQDPEDPEVRDAEAEAHRRRREQPEVSAAEAQSKRRRREDPEVREAEAEAHRRRREQPGVSVAEAEAKQKARIAKPDGATKIFQRLFRDNPFGSVCSVCDRLWFQNDLQPLPDRCHETLEQSFPNSDLTQFKLCSTCIQSVHKGHIPHLSSSNGYVYPPKPAHLPQLNAVSERLISPRIPFMQLRRLMHGGGQHGIKGPVVNVCVDVDDMVTMLPRAMEQDRALNVHLKRRMLAKTTYLAGAVKKCDLLPWLKLLCDSTLYKHYNIKCDFARLGDIVEVDEHDEIELLPQCSDLNDPIQVATAMTLAQHTLVWDEDKFLAIAPGEGKRPVSILYDEHAEELSFPQIYLGEPRRVDASAKPTVFTHAMSEIRRSDRRGATPQHVLYMAMKVFTHRVAGDMCVAFRNIKALETLTKQQLLDKDFVQQAVEHDMAFMHGIPNTVQYWTKRKKDLFAMIRQLGKPTAFLTLSASEMHWPDLLQLLQRLRLKPGEIEVPLEQMNSIYRAQLVNDDPVVCAIYFDRLHRGSAHAHILLWLHNAPNEELSMLMPQTLEIANVLLSIDNGCLKRERTQMPLYAPFMPIDECMVVVPFPTVDNEAQKKKIESLLNKYEAMHQALETTNYDSMEQFWEHHGVADKAEYISVLRAGTPRATIMLPRTVQQKWVNYFNPWVASILDSNMDLQIVLDTYACAAYVVEYVNKANRGMSNLNRAVQEIVKEKGDMAYSQALRHLGVKMLNAIELSAQEAAWCLLNQDMSEASRKVVFVNSAWPEERTRIRKSNAQMAQEGLVESSTDVWKRTMIERYEDRIPELEPVTLAEFATEYNIYTYRKRNQRRILRYRGYSVDDSVNFKREHVLLFYPFRKEVDILDQNCFERLYEQNIDVILQNKARYHSDVDIEQIRAVCNSMLQSNDGEHCATSELPDVRLHPMAMENDDSDLLDIGMVQSNAPFKQCPAVCTRQDVMSRGQYLDTMRKTNEEQYEIVREVVHRLTIPDSPPLQIFFTGVAGCGKTSVLISSWTSTTDIATLLVQIMNVRCVIIDEVSMMSADILQKVDSRLRIITCKYLEPFGGLDIILCGDLRQLPPVRAAEVFKRVKTNSVFNTEIAWHHLSYFVLTKVVRQSDLRFSTILTKIGDGAELDSEEIALIQSRFVTQQQAETCCPGGIRLYYSNKESDYYNTNTAIATEDNCVACPARDTIVGFRSVQEKTEAVRKAETLPKAELGNLPANIMLCIGKPYMLTLNVDVSDGLVNGSVGILQYIQYDTLRDPERISLHFGDLGSKIAIGTVAAAKSRQLRALDTNIQQNWTPIERRTVTCVIDKKSRISLGRCQLPKLVYVALSRATDINGLYLTNVDNDFTFYHGKPNPDRVLLDEFRRLQSHKLQTVTAKCYAMIKQPHLFSVAALNVRSLPAHSKDVHHDPILRHASVLCLSETWMDPKQAVEIMDYQYCCGVSREQNRAAGVAIYYLKKLLDIAKRKREALENQLAKKEQFNLLQQNYQYLKDRYQWPLQDLGAFVRSIIEAFVRSIIEHTNQSSEAAVSLEASQLEDMNRMLAVLQERVTSLTVWNELLAQETEAGGSSFTEKAETECERLDEKVSSLLKRNGKLESEADILWSELSCLEEQAEMLISENKHFQQLAENLKQLLDKYNHIVYRHRNLEEEFHVAAQEKRSLKDRCAQLTKEWATARRDLAVFEEQQGAVGQKTMQELQELWQANQQLQERFCLLKDKHLKAEERLVQAPNQKVEASMEHVTEGTGGTATTLEGSKPSRNRGTLPAVRVPFETVSCKGEQVKPGQAAAETHRGLTGATGTAPKKHMEQQKRIQLLKTISLQSQTKLLKTMSIQFQMANHLNTFPRLQGQQDNQKNKKSTRCGEAAMIPRLTSAAIALRYLQKKTREKKKGGML
ncbi:uncharacterized protein LOC120843399, partial [Ixodes scapularis]|uniref:uncharacterized protein LOC120843399 n=1 Tax=Ixodes scapularis TaxID=6945 RepID=UPI001A9E714A